MSIFGKIQNMFAAVAFAEEGEVDMAREMLRTDEKASVKSKATRAA